MGTERTGRRTGAAVELPVPLWDGDLFKHGASEPAVNFLADNPDFELSLRQLAAVTSYSERATREAVDVLEANGVLETVRRNNSRLVRINKSRLEEPDDPILSVPQEEFHMPVRLATESVETVLEDVAGIVVFGSVARGTADRTSDIDLWVLVESNAAQQQHRATKLARDLGDVDIPRSIDLSRLVNFEVLAARADGSGDGAPSFEVDDAIEGITVSSSEAGEWTVEDTNPSGQRYSFEIVVETPTSFLNHEDAIDPELFTDGITLRDSDLLQRVKSEVIDRE